MPLGITSVCYLNTADYASPSWLEIDIINDFMVSGQWDEGDTQTRESRIKRAVKTLFGLEFTGNMRKKVGDTAYTSMIQLMLSDDIGDFLILNGDKTEVGSEGWRVDCQVFEMSEDQGPGSVLYRSFKIKPTLSDNPALAAKVVAGPTIEYAEPGGDATFS